MKIRNRDINIFSMSALDLFASGMGAFILLAVMALPFFGNVSKIPTEAPLQCPEPVICPKPVPCQVCPPPTPPGFQKMEKLDLVVVLDISGSMREDWNGKNKYTIAKQLLYKLIDSVERKNPNVEFAIRGFGFQSPNTQKNCKDSKLLVPFGKNNATKILDALEKISPQGMTPIAYSLQQAVNDFPADDKALNSIILITDGNEN